MSCKGRKFGGRHSQGKGIVKGGVGLRSKSESKKASLVQPTARHLLRAQGQAAIWVWTYGLQHTRQFISVAETTLSCAHCDGSSRKCRLLLLPTQVPRAGSRPEAGRLGCSAEKGEVELKLLLVEVPAEPGIQLPAAGPSPDLHPHARTV